MNIVNLFKKEHVTAPFVFYRISIIKIQEYNGSCNLRQQVTY